MNSLIIRRVFFRLLPAQILLIAIGSLNSVVDGTVAGQLLGPYALVATGLFAPVIKITETINAVMLGGSSILCGKLLGKNQTERTRSVFSLDMLLVLAVSLVLCILCLTAPAGVAGLLGAQGDMTGPLSDYMRGYAPGFVSTMVSTQLCVFLQLEQQEKRIYAGIGVMVASNVLLDFLFVGVLDMAMFGLGLATSISTWAFLAVQLTWYLSGRSILRLNLKKPDLKDLKEILLVGMPGAVTVLCLTIRFFALNYLILQHVGEIGMSAFSAINAFGGLFYATTAGVASATRLLASVYIGEEDRGGLLMIMKTAVRSGLLLVAGAALMFILLAGVWTGIFFPNPAGEVYQLALWGFRLFPVSMPMSAFCVIFVNYYQCRNKMGIVNTLSILDGAAGTILTALVLLPLMGGMGIWAVQLLNGVYTTLAVIVYAAVACRMDIMIRSVEEAVNTSQEVTAFCRKHNIKGKRALYAGLCVEEMACNIVQHGFDRHSSHSVDIRLVYKQDEDLLIRLKDDCRAFNPKEREELFDPADITHNIGIRMVSRIAKSMTYQNMLGLNVLTIRL